MTVKTTIADNCAEHLDVQGKLTPVRRYWLEDHWEFRFPYKDPVTGQRRFKCCRSIEAAREAAKTLQQPVLTPAQVQAATIHETVRRAVQDALNHIPKAPDPAPVEQISFEEVATRFLTGKEQQMTTGELRYASYRDLLTRTEHLKKALGSISTNTLTVSVLDDAIRSLPVKSARSVWNYWATLRTILFWGRDRNMVPASIAMTIRAMSAHGDPQKDADKINPFSAEEVKVILDACLAGRDRHRGAKLAAAVALQAFCGLRSHESCVLDWTGVDLKAGLIRLKANGSKVRRNRTIQLTNYVVSLTNATLTILGSPGVFLAITSQPGPAFLLHCSGGAGLNYTLQTSSNLVDWVVRTNVVADTNGLFDYLETAPINTPTRFYRLKSP